MEYDPRYLAGIVLFNRGDYFEAHEVWEDLWMDYAGPEKKFYQALIQAAVGLLHFCNGNVRGALKLYQSSRDYMQRYGASLLGLDIEQFWQQMTACFRELLDSPDPTKQIVPNEELLPTISLSPEPEVWPDPAAFLPEEKD
jgi:predicted metal-dependent hydrolase